MHKMRFLLCPVCIFRKIVHKGSDLADFLCRKFQKDILSKKAAGISHFLKTYLLQSQYNFVIYLFCRTSFTSNANFSSFNWYFSERTGPQLLEPMPFWA